MIHPFKGKKFLITGGSGFIGSNLIGILSKIEPKVEILNLDKNKPSQKLNKYWLKGDINHKKSFFSNVIAYKPDYIIHLAAEAKMGGENLDDFETNILGVKNLIDCCNKLSRKAFLVITSSQHVKKPGSFTYGNKKEYDPLGLYGESKVLTEQIVLNSDLKQKWIIIRPTLVWGPNNYVMANNIFNYLRKGIYMHPSNDNTVRAYGYVENLCHQILDLCKIEYSNLSEKVIYLADHNLLQIEWLTISSEIIFGKSLKTIPKGILKIGSLTGDYIKKFYPTFPLYMERYRNLTTSNPIPLENTFAILGKPKVNLYDAMNKTKNWLTRYYAK